MKMVLAVALSGLLFFICSGDVSNGRKKGTWCVAKPSATDAELTNNINFACQTLKTRNCTQLIEEGGCCREPNTLINHASVVMNVYYAENGGNYWNCDFTKTGLVTVTDPSYGNCKYM